MKNKKKSRASSSGTRSNKSTLQKAIWIAMICLVVVFVIFALIFRQSIKQISKDPSLTSLTNESIFRIIQIVNANKNRGEECWNMMNPLNPCNESNKITAGNYELKGTRDLKWLEPSSKSKYKLSEDFIREILAGFMLNEHEYFQTISIKYPTSETMQITVITENNNGDTNSQLINLNAK